MSTIESKLSTPSLAPAPATATVASRVRHIGCVSFLNARPLIEGLDEGADPAVKFDVPSRLLDDLEAGDVDIALCPVIDFQRSKTPLAIVPVGGIGCDGPTLTVRLYSRCPVAQLTEILIDSDSHTSIALLRVLLAELHNLRPRLIDYHAREHVADSRVVMAPQAMLLIGDKVITSAPSTEQYPHQVDLGEAWKKLTGLPFVFAVWMCRQGASLGDLPAKLAATRHRNADRIDAIVARRAPKAGWPMDLARLYLGQWLKYEIGPRQMQAMELFYAKAKEHGVIEALRPMVMHAAD